MSATGQVQEPDSKINTSDALSYWSTIDADVNGMLGGFPYVSRVDLQGSRNFLAKLGVHGGKKVVIQRVGKEKVEDDKATEDEFAESDGRLERAVDCGAGIGRITSGLLLDVARTVDVVEPIAKFSAGLVGKEGVGQIFNIGLEAWTPEVQYDLMWHQWCLGHLTDAQLVEYLRKCVTVLKKETGLIVVKENLSTSLVGEDLFDEIDSSVTRTEAKFKKIFAEAGLKIKKTELQKGLPKELYPVRSWALRP